MRGVVHQNVETTEFVDGLGNRRAHRSIVGDIGDQREYPVYRHRNVAVEDRHIGATACQLRSCGLPDTRSTAGDECRQAGKLA